MFYAVVALGYFYNFTSYKHRQYLGWFNKKFVYTEKIFDEKLFKLYKEAYGNRHKSDYEFMWKPVKEDVLNDLNESIIFVETIRTHINKS